MIAITDKARELLKRNCEDKDSFVRISVTSGGCSGMTYNAEIDSTRRDNEKILLSDEEITIVSDDESLPFLEGLSIDYSDDLISAGFRFNNNNNENSCGCGASFSLTGFPELKTSEVVCES